MAISRSSLSGTRQVLIFPLFDYTSDAQTKLPAACERGRPELGDAFGETRVPAVRLLFGTITELIWQPASKHISDAYKIKTLSGTNDAALFDQSGRFIIPVIATIPGICALVRHFQYFQIISELFQILFQFAPRLQLHVTCCSHPTFYRSNPAVFANIHLLFTF